ncbi:hypothetical protein BDA96_04G158900 [Sorghum bicolor]|uniref:Ankyrin-like protein n=1 Tax=Sorghum bicolor TaxID=4558 RepID=A0A921UIR8_SORBI|nr:hypothetical protein BDA96_04G158900 [Sorghum bicolor]
MAPPQTSGLGAPQRRLLQAAADGDLQLFKRTASALDAGKGRLREAVEAVKSRGAGALHFAAGRGRLAVCVYMVEELHTDVDASDDKGDTPLAYAIQGGTVDTVQYLLDHDANPDKPIGKGSTPLHLAAAGGNCEMLKALLSKGANVDSLSDTGTPLHVAAYCKQDGAMKILLDHGADYNKVFNTVCTPLFVSLTSRSLECVKLLIKAGADVKGVGTVTPLIVAVNNGLTDFYNCLLEAGADPDVRDDFGHLPIELAAYENRRKDVEILLPVTSRVPYVRDWSVDGIIDFVRSMPSVEGDPMYKMKPDDIKFEGNKAYKRKDYLTAVKLYSMAINHRPDDTTLYSNRCLCWIKMGEGVRAFTDAGICRMQCPDSAKACYLQGAANMLLKDYKKACDAFLDGLKLDPANVEIEKALRDAVNCLKTLDTAK